AFACAGLSDLHQQFSILRELHDHTVVEEAQRAAGLAFIGRLPLNLSAAAGGLVWRRATAIASDPDVAFVIDSDAMVGLRPFVALAFAAPVSNEITGLIEFQNRRCRQAAGRARRIGGRINFLWFQGALPMDDPYMVLRIGRNSNRVAEEPMVRQWLRPQRIDFK